MYVLFSALTGVDASWKLVMVVVDENRNHSDCGWYPYFKNVHSTLS